MNLLVCVTGWFKGTKEKTDMSYVCLSLCVCVRVFVCVCMCVNVYV